MGCNPYSEFSHKICKTANCYFSIAYKIYIKYFHFFFIFMMILLDFSEKIWYNIHISERFEHPNVQIANGEAERFTTRIAAVYILVSPLTGDLPSLFTVRPLEGL